MKYLVQCHIHMHEDRELFAKILAMQNESRKEEGCISYLVCQEPTNTSHYLVLQRWENKDYFEKHLNSSHYKKFVEYIHSVTNKPISYDYFDIN
ncbi:Antibiotic biosynthesis monooxygenase, putative [Entamoeba histolytica]